MVLGYSSANSLPLDTKGAITSTYNKVCKIQWYKILVNFLGIEFLLIGINTSKKSMLIKKNVTNPPN